MPLEVGRGQNVGIRDFFHILTLLPPGASVFHKHMSSYRKLTKKVHVYYSLEILICASQTIIEILNLIG